VPWLPTTTHFVDPLAFADDPDPRPRRHLCISAAFLLLGADTLELTADLWVPLQVKDQLWVSLVWLCCHVLPAELVTVAFEPRVSYPLQIALRPCGNNLT
jgi:hypothetical protein